MGPEYVEQQYVQGFRANLNLAPQQSDTIYLNAVDAEPGYSEPGKMFNLDDLGVSDPKDVTTIVPDSPEGMVQQTRRVGFFKGFNDGKFIDSAAKARQLVDPTNKVMDAMIAGKHRKQNACVRDAFFAPSRSGENGEISANFPGSQIILVDNRKFLHQDEVVPGSGALPLTVGKLIFARNKLKKGRVKGKLMIACTADQISDLLARTPTTSKHYTALSRLDSGEVNSFLGFTFLEDQDLALKTGTTDTRLIPAWVDQAMVYKSREIQNAHIVPRADKSFRQYAYYEAEHGAARRYDEGVVQIECLES